MNTLVIYDENGAVIATMSGGEHGAIGTAVVEVPENMTVSHVNTATGEVVLAPKPATEAERTAALEKQMMQAASNHSGAYEDPIPFVYGMATVKGRYYSFGGDIYVWNSADCVSCVWLPTQGIWEWEKAVPSGNAEGTISDPIPAVAGMEYTYGKYYHDPDDLGTYLCIRTGEAEGGTVVLHFLPHELAGQYFELI